MRPVVPGQPGPEHDEPGPCRKAGTLLAVELPHGPVGLIKRQGGFTDQRRGLRDEQAHLGHGDAAVRSFEFRDGFLRRLACLCHQVDGHEQLAAVVEQPAELVGVEGAVTAFGQVEVVQGARHVTLHRTDPAEGGVHDGQR